MTRKWIFWLPLLVTVALFVTFLTALVRPSDRLIASQLVGKPIPAFYAPAALPGQMGTRYQDYADGKPKLLNVFASWCGPCVEEIPVLLQLQAMGVEINGVAIHDRPQDLARFFAENGNPYTRVGLDQGGQAQMAFGSSGVPETFIIDGQGRVIDQHIGVITQSEIPAILAKLKAH
ncbi:MAG: redoxin family protein [Alphaproteobacteria bacterium]|nr:redoxin family protein [Alphaproteobacteria bacterium]